MKDKLKRIVKFSPAYDKRDADPKKNYGIDCVRCWMVLKGKKGAVQFVFSTGMYLLETHKEWLSRFGYNDNSYMGLDVGYHSPYPMYEGQTIQEDKCEWIEKACYYDGSTLRVVKFLDVFVREGDEAVWKLLEQDYKERFYQLGGKE